MMERLTDSHLRRRFCQLRLRLYKAVVWLDTCDVILAAELCWARAGNLLCMVCVFRGCIHRILIATERYICERHV